MMKLALTLWMALACLLCCDGFQPGMRSIVSRVAVCKPMRMCFMPPVHTTSSNAITPAITAAPSPCQPLKTLWDFSRPHTLIGSGLSIISLYLYAIPCAKWNSPEFLTSLVGALVPGLATNLYITGLNQLTDVAIDKVNKPYLPIAAGKLSEKQALHIVTASLLVSMAFAAKAHWPLRTTLIGSALLGTLYSLPPFRLKRFPMLAAFSILTVRGALLNMGFFFQAKQAVLGAKIPSLASGLQQFSDVLPITGFFAFFGLVIALLKDVPDIKGDKQHDIGTFSVKMGAKRMLELTTRMLVGLLIYTSITLTKGIDSFAAAHSPRIFVSSVLASAALEVVAREGKTNTEDPKSLFAFYMHVWNIFYACYAMLPLLQFGKQQIGV